MRHLQRPSGWGRVGPIREIKIHVYAKRPIQVENFSE